jgi:hypothetical protein
MLDQALTASVLVWCRAEANAAGALDALAPWLHRGKNKNSSVTSHATWTWATTSDLLLTKMNYYFPTWNSRKGE